MSSIGLTSFSNASQGIFWPREQRDAFVKVDALNRVCLENHKYDAEVSLARHSLRNIPNAKHMQIRRVAVLPLYILRIASGLAVEAWP